VTAEAAGAPEAPDDAVAAWAGLDDVERLALVQAWEALRAGSIGVGAVVTAPDGTVVAASRNRCAEATAPPGEVCGSTVAHAEVNALARVPFRSERIFTLTTSLQPCLQCSAVIRQSAVARVRVIGPDPLWDGCHDLTSLNPWVARRAPVPVDGPRYDTVGAFASLLCWAGPWLIPAVVDALRAHGQGPLLDLAAEVTDDGTLAALLPGPVDAALAALWPRLAPAVRQPRPSGTAPG
jgi:tRNA(Arg) A34 adenosine deaminase TadA